MKWQELYSSENELIEDMLKTLSDPRKHSYYKLVRGYEYIDGFKRYYKANGYLTDRQLTQLKRLAGEVYKNVKERR